MSIVQEFRDFAVKGNVIDLAVGVIIGAAFGKITASLTDDILNPIIGRIFGKVDFSNLFLNLSDTPIASVADAKKAGVPVLAYGNFLTAIINFLIVAFAMFLLIKAVNRFKSHLDAAAAAPTATEKLLAEIRDLMQEEVAVTKGTGGAASTATPPPTPAV